MNLKFLFVASVAMFISACATQNISTIPEASETSIGYSDVNLAYHDLKSNGDFQETTERDWIILTNDKTKTIWSFSPESHSSYPSAVKRQVVTENNTIFVKTSILCKSSKLECDSLAKSFKDLN